MSVYMRPNVGGRVSGRGKKGERRDQDFVRVTTVEGHCPPVRREGKGFVRAPTRWPS